MQLYPQHCIMTTFTPEQRVIEVHKNLQKAIMKLNKRSHKNNKSCEKSIDKSKKEDPNQRVKGDNLATSNN